MGTEISTARATGRPRDPRIEQAALAAVRALLAEGGYAAVTVSAVAARAGTTKAALYRRWPALPHLVHEAAFPSDLALDLHLGGSLEEDLAGIVRGARDALCSPVGAAALPALLAEITTWPDLHAAMLERFAGSFRAIDERLAVAVAAGEAHPDARADDLLRLVIGAVIAGVLLTPGQLDDAWADRLTDSLVRSLRP
ncbi:TetR-like C-terminal domain-containing protein [Nocardioides nitrophenolicus]|uniref:TetR-like C-terminal domain-containing protein n=1 Tax=Nocardioides nitrophenolicus TaxID=60489 RepID=UPI00195A961D|nr:TetR-like C-terminal domain-containing protein [Nocardioides nitrophenolicus]MBM7518951.1 AcrR family transcriptional regulator [Nocardioides nitrophenolicus]